MYQAFAKIQFWVWHADMTKLVRMRINVMAAAYPAQDPSIRFQLLDDKSAIHSGYDIHLMEENKPFSHEEIRCCERMSRIFPRQRLSNR